MKKYIYLVIAAIFLATSCQGQTTQTVTPTIVISPTVTSLPDAIGRQYLSVHYDPKSEVGFQVDLRGSDLNQYDLRNSTNDLLYSDFSTKTKWPEQKWIPAGFDPQKILELGKNPGLGVRSLHAQGITGKGVSIAIIDQPLTPANHIEYVDRLKMNENIGSPGTMSMHGPAVASILAGKTVGVAPEANLYYFATELPYTKKGENDFSYDYSFLTKAFRRILEINQTLSEAEKIRVISISLGWLKGEKGYDDLLKAIDDVKKVGIFVVSTSLNKDYPGFRFNGLGRDPFGDPDQISSYTSGIFWISDLTNPKYSGNLTNQILIPMDSRAYASYWGSNEYNWGRMGGWSWCVPYIAGLYALAFQLDPQITPEIFWDIVVKTAQPITAQANGQKIPIGSIIQPVSVIETLKKK